MAASRRELVYLVLQCAILVFSIIGVGVLAKAYTLQHYYYSDGDGNTYDMLPWFAFIISFVWITISIPLIYFHKRRTRFSADAAAEPNVADTITLPCPPVFVSLDFIVSGLAFSMGGILLAWCAGNVSSTASFDYPWYGTSCYYIEPDQGFSSAGECYRTARLLNNLEWTGAILCMLNGIFHFVLFVHACRQCDRWRKARVARKKAVQHGQDWVELNETVVPKP